MSHRGYVVRGGRPDYRASSFGSKNSPLLTRREAWEVVKEVRNYPGREFTRVYKQGNLEPVYSE